ncbi:hypothetical protein BSKO_01964 [Bryopsis sp. KO-2023]|nr:hypothetical protein BSKO_01964 [Bryopsis sp. KO-2023]
MEDGTGLDPSSRIPYQSLPSLPEGEIDTPELAGAESYELEAHTNLDRFFTRIYRFWHGKGFYNIVLREVINLLALLFTILFSAFLLLFVKWEAIHNSCVREGTCSLSSIVDMTHPFVGDSVLWILLRIFYLIFFSLYWVYALVVFLVDLPGLWDVKRFCNYRLGISEREIQWVSWPELLHRVVRVQKKTRLCVTRDLTEHDIISRIMRKENYLIGMLNKGVLALNIPIPGFRRRFLLTKTLEWNIYWCVLDAMFAEDFTVKEKFKTNPEVLRSRFRMMALANLALAPFVFVFLVIYFLMKNAEKFYTTPSTIVARGWSPLAKWHMREFNEVSHLVEVRLANSLGPSKNYIDQFPNHKMMHIGKLLSFVVGSFTALILLLAVLDDGVMENGHLQGRNLVWWAALLTVILRMSRGLIQEQTAFDPEGEMRAVVEYTHFVPRRWRGKAHTKEVQQEFQSLFQYKAQIFLEELASVVLTPFVLYFSLPRSAGAILEFVRKFTLHKSGVGDVCSFADFKFDPHGNRKYASPFQKELEADKRYFRSKQGKMEKSFLSFVTTYPTWEPRNHGKKMLSNLLPYSNVRKSGFPNRLGCGMGMGVVKNWNWAPPAVDFEKECVSVEKQTKQQKSVGKRGGEKCKPGLERQDSIEMSTMVSRLSREAGEDQTQLASSLLSGSSESQSEQQLDKSNESCMEVAKEWGKWSELNDPFSSILTGGVVDVGLSLGNWSAVHQFSGLDDKIRESQAMLQCFYNDHEETVRHRFVNRSSQFRQRSWMDWVVPADS